jgi:hypothetical protein
MRNLFLHSIAMLRSKRLVALHLVANAVLLAGASLWLLIPDEHGWQLLASAVSALLMLFLFLWLNSGTLAYSAGKTAQHNKVACDSLQFAHDNTYILSSLRHFDIH